MIEPRRYKDTNDLEAMRSLLSAGRIADNGSYYIHPGDLDWWLYYPPLEGDFWDHVYLWDDPGQPGRILGWALLSPDWVGIDVYTQPELRCCQAATNMYLWAEHKAAQIAGENHKSTIYVVWVWHTDELLGEHFRQRGFQLKRGYVHLTRKLDEVIPADDVPHGFIVRSCRGEPEVTARARAQYGAFASSAVFERYQQRFTDFMRSPVYDPDKDIVVADPDGQIGAFCIVWTDILSRVGHFEPVGTHPDFQRKGLGRAVMDEGLRRLQAAGMKSADVVTFEDNTGAIKFYESMGFEVTGKLGTFEKEV